MTWLILALMLALSSPFAFGQTTPPYDVTTPEGYREWAIRYAYACHSLGLGSVRAPFSEGYDSPPWLPPKPAYLGSSLFVWRFTNERNTEDGFTLLPSCIARRTHYADLLPEPVCHTEPKPEWTGGPTVARTLSCAQLRLPPLPSGTHHNRPGFSHLPEGYSQYGERPSSPFCPNANPNRFTDDPVGFLEVPANGSFQSGIGYVSGWVCDGARVSIVIDGGLHLPPVARNISRGDTEAVCGDRDNGFILHWNWNLMGDGTYTAALVVDGKTLQSNTFTVTTLGEEFIRGLERDVVVNDFPAPGETTRFRWQEAVQGLVLVPTD